MKTQDIVLTQEEIEWQEVRKIEEEDIERQALKMAKVAEDICAALTRGATIKAAELVLGVRDSHFDKVMAFTHLLLEARRP